MFDIKNMAPMPEKYFHQTRGYMIDKNGNTTSRFQEDNLGAVIFYMAEPHGKELVGFQPKQKV